MVFAPKSLNEPPQSTIQDNLLSPFTLHAISCEEFHRRHASVLQCVAVCCSVLQCVAVCCSVLHVKNFTGDMLACRSVMKSDAVWCSVMQCVAECCAVLQCVVVCCSVLQSV